MTHLTWTPIPEKDSWQTNLSDWLTIDRRSIQSPFTISLQNTSSQGFSWIIVCALWMHTYINTYLRVRVCCRNRNNDSAVRRNQLVLMFLFSKTKTESSLTGTFLLCSNCRNGQLECTGDEIVPGRYQKKTTWLLAVHCHCGRWEAEVKILKIS